MGLLDMANDPLMGMAAGLLGGGNFGQALGRGLTNSQAMQLAEQERKLRESQAQENAARAKHYQDQQAQASAAGQRESQFQKAIQDGIPLPEVARYFPEKLDTIKKLADAPNFGRQAVARTMDVEGPNGAKMVRQLDQYGQPVGTDTSGYVPPQGVNLGGKYIFTKPTAGQSFDMTQSPDSLASNALTMRGQNMTDSRARERLAFDRQGGAEAGKPPAGYRWKPDGSLEAIAGGPAAGNKLTESEGKSTLYLSQMRDATKALDKIGENASPLMVAATGSPYTNWIAGETPQKAGQAQRQWAEAYLREKTGAAATAGEVENNIRTFFPVVGDGPDVIAQKKTARAEAEKAMEIPAGRGAARIPVVEPAKPPAMMDAKPTANASNRGKVIRETDASGNPTGKSFKSNGMQWVEQ